LQPVPIEEITTDRLVRVAREYGITAETNGESALLTINENPLLVAPLQDLRLLLFWIMIPVDGQEPDSPIPDRLLRQLNDLNQLAFSLRFTIPAGNHSFILADYSIPLELYTDDFFPALARQFHASVMEALEMQVEAQKQAKQEEKQDTPTQPEPQAAEPSQDDLPEGESA